MKALRQKRLTRTDGTKVSKRGKKSTKALWKQALVTKSAESEVETSSECAGTPHDVPNILPGIEQVATTIASAPPPAPLSTGAFPPLGPDSFQELRDAIPAININLSSSEYARGAHVPPLQRYDKMRVQSVRLRRALRMSPSKTSRIQEMPRLMSVHPTRRPSTSHKPSLRAT
jgi:hypothetical protein